MFMIPPDDEFDPSRIYHRFVAELPEFAELKEYEPEVRFLFRVDEKIKAGRRVLGTCYMPGVQGDLSSLFDWMLERELGVFPDYLIVLDHAFWTEGTALDRDALLFHEMLHCGIALDKFDAPRFNKLSGQPVWAVKSHDIEAFNAEVARFGAWKSDIAGFLAAAAT